MFPLPLQFIIAMVAYAINERMARRLDYLLEEIRVLREVYTETTGRKRIPFTDESASTAGSQRQGVDARRTGKLLPNRSSRYDPDLISPTHRQEVLQLHTTQETGQASQAQQDP